MIYRLQGVGYHFIAPSLSSEQQEALKWVAIISMTIAHAGYLSNQHELFYTIGRLALPAFAFMMVYNFIHYTSSPLKYVLRLLAVGAVAQVPYAYLFNIPFYHLNVMFTLGSGLLMIWALDYAFFDTKNLLLRVGIAYGVITFALVTGWTVDGIYLAQIMILAFWVWLRFPSHQTLYVAVGALLIMNFPSSYLNAIAGLLFFIVLELIITFDIRAPKLSKWSYYAFYPGHMTLISLSKVFL